MPGTPDRTVRSGQTDWVRLTGARVPALDGVRGLAILSVVVAHVLAPNGLVTGGGVVGVTLFFVLSGYLIVGLLLRETAATGTIDLRGFYVRRARRLLPALVVVVLCAPVLMFAVNDPQLAGYPKDVVAVMTYLGNVVVASGQDLGPLTHTWSLAVEEQFYLLAPVALLVARRWPRTLVNGLWVAALLAVVWRFVAASELDYARVYTMLDTNAYGLLLGGALAAHEWRHGKRQARTSLAVAAAVVLVALAVVPDGGGVWMLAVGTPLAAVAGGLLVVNGSALAVLSAPVLTWLGRVSYGWYLWHMLLISLEVNGERVGLVGRVVFAAASLGIAVLSLRFVERRWLRLPADDPVRAGWGYEPVRGPGTECVVTGPQPGDQHLAALVVDFKGDLVDRGEGVT